MVFLSQQPKQTTTRPKICPLELAIQKLLTVSAVKEAKPDLQSVEELVSSKWVARKKLYTSLLKSLDEERD